MLSRQILLQRLVHELSPAVANTLVAGLPQTTGKPDTEARVLTLLNELQELSEKAASSAVTALPELDRRAGLSHIILWLDLGVALAQSSGASALKYFKDSPLVLGLIEPVDARTEVLTIGLEIAEQDANVALEYIRNAPQILSVVPVPQLRPWLDIGIELTEVNVVVGLEFIRQISNLAPVLPSEAVRNWATVGMKLIVPNSLGKPDYMATIEFLRTSPSILGNIEDPPPQGSDPARRGCGPGDFRSEPSRHHLGEDAAHERRLQRVRRLADRRSRERRDRPRPGRRPRWQIHRPARPRPVPPAYSEPFLICLPRMTQRYANPSESFASFA